MKNVAPKARSLDSDRPFTIAAIACSRMPKCRFLPPGVAGLEISRALVLQGGLVRRPEIRRAAEEATECSARARSAPCPRRRARRRPSGRPERPGDCGPNRPAARAAASGRFRSRARDTSPGRPRTAPSIARGPPRRARRCRRRSARGTPSGTRNLRVLGPAVAALGEADLFLAERLAVGRGGVLLVRRTVADVAVEDDEGRPALRLPEDIAARARCARCRWRRRRAARSSRSRGIGPRRPR